MGRQTSRIARRRFAASLFFAAISAGVPNLANAQSLACSPGGAAGGLYGAGPGLLGGLSLGWPGIAAGGPLSFAAAGAAGDPAPVSCAPGEPASIAVEAPSTLAGNPVDVVTGSKLDRAIDAYLPTPASGSPDDAAELVLSRFYASDSPGSAALGPGWRAGLDVRLYAAPAGGRRMLSIVQGDGRQIAFGPPRAAPGGARRHAAREHEDGVLEEQPEGQQPDESRWVWHWRNGRRLVFDAYGRLRRITSRAGSQLALDYDRQGRLSAVRSAAGLGVGLRYHDDAHDGPASYDGRPGAYPGRLAALFDAGGERVRYEYDGAGRLARLRFADGGRVDYEYDGPLSRRLVAVVLPDGRRSEYRYRPDGRVVYSRAAGETDAMAMRLEYRGLSPDGASGETALRIGGELRATYHWARPAARAQARLTSAVGPGCERCPATGRRYRYDPVGRLVSVRGVRSNDSASRGPALEILRDARGRPRTLRWGPGAERSLRIAWRDDELVDILVGVDRPSVVSGQRARSKPLRDAHGRTVGLEEHGYAPAFTDGDEAGEPTGATSVRRIADFVGTRPAGSAARTETSPVVAPAGTLPSEGSGVRLWRDDFGRAVALRTPDAGLVRRSFDERDRLQSELRADGSTARYRYDGDGRLVEYQEASSSGRLGAAVDGAVDGADDATLDGALDAPVDPSAANAVATTRFRWSRGRLAEVEHDGQREVATTDGAGRVVGRRTELRLESGRVVEFETGYEYDASGRLRAWSLPGGGWIRAHADPSGQIVSLEWQPARGSLSLPLVTALERDAHGLRRVVFGNGIAATTRRTENGRLAEIRHRSTLGAGRGRDVLHHRFAFDAGGRLTEWWRSGRLLTYLYDADGRLLQAYGHARAGEMTWRFAYDANGNRVLAQRSAPGTASSSQQSTERFATVGPGNRLRRTGPAQATAPELPARAGSPDVSSRSGGSAASAAWDRAESVAFDSAASARWDSAGRLVSEARRSYDWDAGGRLRAVRDAGRTIARYRYDARGQRVAKLVDGIATHYLYDAQRRLVAELDAQGEVFRQYVYLADRPVAVLDRRDAPGAAKGGARVPRSIRFLHLNHLGAPEAVTDERARVIWRAEYAPFGRRLDQASPVTTQGNPAGFELALRLPGQYEDPETGLHYNDHRYYDPDTGRYLSPDPLGLAAGPNPYVYAGNDPLTRVDPSGLLLFAFDGTDNGDPPARRDDWSNVYKLARAYSDGRVWYMAGVGRDDSASGIRTNGLDAINANTARARVDYLLGELDAFVSAPSSRAVPIDIDVIGFSRGAAMARDFSNRVAARIRDGEFGRIGACVRLRFLGLWDTVAQFGADGIANLGWRLAVPAEAAYAAQAVALERTPHAVSSGIHRREPAERRAHRARIRRRALGYRRFVCRRRPVGRRADLDARAGTARRRAHVRAHQRVRAGHRTAAARLEHRRDRRPGVPLPQQPGLDLRQADAANRARRRHAMERHRALHPATGDAAQRRLRRADHRRQRRHAELLGLAGGQLRGDGALDALRWCARRIAGSSLRRERCERCARRGHCVHNRAAAGRASRADCALRRRETSYSRPTTP